MPRDEINPFQDEGVCYLYDMYYSGEDVKAKLANHLFTLNGNLHDLTQEKKIYGLSEGGEDAKICVICLSELKEYACKPCMHLCVCSECAGFLLKDEGRVKCPMCRGEVEGLVKVGGGDG